MTEFQSERRRKEIQLRTQVNQKLEENGERERLRELLRARLKECGWRDQLKDHCRDVISKKGIGNVTVDSLVEEITPTARASVPDFVKKELLEHIRKYLDQK